MQVWDGWPLERFIYLFIGAAFLLVWLQVTLYHWRAGFHNKFMWGPVLYTPLLVIAALLLGFVHGGALNTIFVVLFALGALEGLIGIILHSRGVALMVGGFSMRNLMSGPPIVLTLVYFSLSGFGLLVFYWPQIIGMG